MKRALPFIAIAGCVVVALAWFLMWYSPAGDDVSSTNATTAGIERENAELAAQIASLRAVEDQAPALEARAAALKASVPAESSLDGFIIEANRIAKANGITWVAVTPSPVAPDGPGGVGVIGFTTEVHGSYSQLRDYLEGLVSGSRLVVIDGVTISPGTEEAGDDADTATTPSELQATVEGRIFTGELPAGAEGAGARSSASLADQAKANGGETGTS